MEPAVTILARKTTKNRSLDLKRESLLPKTVQIKLPQQKPLIYQTIPCVKPQPQASPYCALPQNPLTLSMGT